MKMETSILIVKKEKAELTGLLKDCWRYCDKKVKSKFTVVLKSDEIDNKDISLFIKKNKFIEQNSESFLNTWGEKLNIIGMENIIKFEMNSSWDMGYIIYKKPTNKDENEELEYKTKNSIIAKEILTPENIYKSNQEKWQRREIRIEKLKLYGGELRTIDKHF